MSVLQSTHQLISTINSLELPTKLRGSINSFICLHTQNETIYNENPILTIGSFAGIRFRTNLTYILENINNPNLIDELNYFISVGGLRE